ncbi:hypothetical protein EV356DRAFT_537934 [Viridothelium virens]|uniref:Uncharacterized protein n=1 Tax=Viridothelium virens TaxID=1048519 RepID=A0A6A6GSA0_VIRVR|nr:hypothetical protein EV356DRAFT_537934 [Viridothelium virens]
MTTVRRGSRERRKTDRAMGLSLDQQGWQQMERYRLLRGGQGEERPNPIVKEGSSEWHRLRNMNANLYNEEWERNSGFTIRESAKNEERVRRHRDGRFSPYRLDRPPTIAHRDRSTNSSSGASTIANESNQGSGSFLPESSKNYDIGRDGEVSAMDKEHVGTVSEGADEHKDVRPSRPRRKTRVGGRKPRTSPQIDRTNREEVFPQTSVNTSTTPQKPSDAPSNQNGNSYLKDPNKTVDKFNIRYFKKPKPMSFYIQQQANYTRGMSSAGSAAKISAVPSNEQIGGQLQESAAALSTKSVP